MHRMTSDDVVKLALYLTVLFVFGFSLYSETLRHVRSKRQLDELETRISRLERAVNGTPATDDQGEQHERAAFAGGGEPSPGR